MMMMMIIIILIMVILTGCLCKQPHKKMVWKAAHHKDERDVCLFVGTHFEIGDFQNVVLCGCTQNGKNRIKWKWGEVQVHGCFLTSDHLAEPCVIDTWLLYFVLTVTHCQRQTLQFRRWKDVARRIETVFNPVASIERYRPLIDAVVCLCPELQW